MGGPAPVQWLRDRKDMHRLYSADTLTDGRRVALELQMPLTDILAPGEAVPNDALHELYAKARAPAILISYCPEILGPLGTRCDVLNTEGQLARDGQIRIKGSLSYLPSYEVGDLSAVENGEVLTGTITVIDRKDKLPFGPDSRADAIDEALRFCDLVRATFGNCLISRLTLSQKSTRSRDDPTLMLNASVQVSVFADNTLYRRESFRQELLRIQETLIN